MRYNMLYEANTRRVQIQSTLHENGQLTTGLRRKSFQCQLLASVFFLQKKSIKIDLYDSIDVLDHFSLFFWKLVENARST